MQPTVEVDSGSWLAIESPEFAVRFGRLLTATRRRSKRSIEELAASSPVAFETSQLRQFEQGSTTIDASIIDGLCLLYSADVGRILPARRPVTIADGRLSAVGVSFGFSPGDPTSLMVAYLRLIRRMRNQKKAPAIALRREDILTLAHYLEIDGADVVERLSTLMNVSSAQRRTMAILFASGAIVIGLAAGAHASASTSLPHFADTSVESGRVVAESDHDLALDGAIVVTTEPATLEVAPPASTPYIAPITVPASPPATSSTRSSPIAGPVRAENVARVAVVASSLASDAVGEVESAAVIDQIADVVGLPAATRVQVPAAAPPSTVAAAGPTPNQSGCNPDPSEAIMSVVIPDIAYTCPVYAGGQSMIDAGFVTLVTDAGANPVLATSPGGPGTLWLAGHRTTHGAAFSRVPDLADGALVTVSSGDVTATYRVVGRSYVEVRGGRVVDAAGDATPTATWASIIRDDFGGDLAPRLVLQTCDGESFRWMIYADLVT